jgi:predicted MFS family arabinose efflux permease
MTLAESRPTPLSVKLALTALLPFALGYFLSYLFRAVNAVVAPDLTRELGLNAQQLGLLTAAYLFAFAAFQIPLGMLLDRYGPRRVQAALLAIAALGALLFALGQDTLSLGLARGLIGFGFAGGLMSGFKAVVIWVPEARRGFASACVMSLGALGLVVSTAPTEFAVALYGWRAVFAGLAGVTLAVAALVFLAVPRGEPAATPISVAAQFRSVWQLLRDPAFLRLAPLLGLSAGSHIAIQTLWAAAWWRDVGGLDRTAVAHQLFIMAAAFFVGILGTGAMADWFIRRGVSTLDVMLGFMVAFITAQVCIVLNVAAPVAWCLFGMLGQVAVLAFPWLSGYFGAALSGRANATMNLFIFATAFIAQWLIGAIIDQFAPSATGAYPLEAYQTGFGAFVTLQVLALLWYLPARKSLIQAAARPKT